MKKLLFLAMLVATIGSAFAFKAADISLTGYIGDSMCAAKGKANSAAHAACAIKCIKGGAAAVLVVGDKVYQIANQKKVLKYAGKKVTIEGTVTDDSIEVKTIAEAK